MLKLNLLENSFNSLNEGLNFYIRGDEEGNPILYKFSILLISHTIELILKEVLRREHYSLVYTDIDNKKVKRLEDLHTVDIETAISRIERVLKINLPHTVKAHIEEIRKTRNKIQHYEIDLTLENARDNISKAFFTIKHLTSELLRINLNDYIEEETIEKLEEIESIRQEALKVALEHIKSNNLKRTKVNLVFDKDFTIPCPACGENTLISVEESNSNKQKCYFCFSEYNDIEDCFKNDESEYISDHLKKKFRPFANKAEVTTCLECNSDNLVYQSLSEKWFCIYCLEKRDSDYCQNCGDPIPYQQYVGSFYNEELELEYEEICTKCCDDEKYIDVSQV